MLTRNEIHSSSCGIPDMLGLEVTGDMRLVSLELLHRPARLAFKLADGF
jgi:hypothetical protein